MHDKHSRSRGELWFGRQLRDAARREQPEFSEALHQRIMQAVRPTTADATAVDQVCGDLAPAVKTRSGISRRRSNWRSAALLSAAAAIFAMVIAARWFAGAENRNGSQQPQPAPVASVAVQPGPIATLKIDQPAVKPITASPADREPNDIASAVSNYTLDDLSRDARATAHLLVDQLPFETPAEEWGL